MGGFESAILYTPPSTASFKLGHQLLTTHRVLSYLWSSTDLYQLCTVSEILAFLQGSSQITPPAPHSTSWPPCPRRAAVCSPCPLWSPTIRSRRGPRKEFQLRGCHLLSRLPVATTSNSSAHLRPLPTSVKDATLPGNYQGERWLPKSS